jgi:hypothetical protein
MSFVILKYNFFSCFHILPQVLSTQNGTNVWSCNINLLISYRSVSHIH